ncbi:sensor domain-containing protein [Pseudomonas panipatensis]|uniref:cyclic-guanylate-specific phosphodiesterase n=1 Tax=Pseudomonas panipatensis TaxID=428992 RepID=A0A1G8L4C1_9PSED|nr:EAL domain-containing protein [Pseudomonas panipatensis]SDI50544.1 PAS domain S-box-containing protein/diguanylate cyclase (GGDEF) domain-containing protein [Pseudomonas panipatensis]SMP72514.1 diguanylate cyclase/phosphodiesterase with PAS/PAC sensor(s) [Pseudomonas panipatensis]
MTPHGNRSTETSLAQLAALDRVMAIAEFTPDGTVLHANRNYQSLLGYADEEIRGRHHSTFCPPSLVRSPAYAEFWSLLSDGASRSGIEERVRRNGSSCWLEATYTPVFEGGRVVQVLKIATDITERLQQQRAQQERLKLLSLVADVSDTAVVICNAHARIAYTNAGFERTFGWRDDEVQGRNPVELLAPQLDAQSIAQLHAELYGGRSLQREEIVTGKQGQRYWAKITSNPIFDDAGRLQHTVTLLTDITQAKMHEALQHQVLEAMAREQPLTEILELICLEVERIAPEITASILAVDEQGLLHSLASPSLPQEYSRQLNGLSIGPAVGSCGTAAWRNEAVRVDNIAEDPLWADFLHLALPVGIIGCWSTPIRNSQGRPIGTFAFYFRQPRNAAYELFHQRLVDACAHLCALALERENARQRIRQLAFYDGLTGLPNRSLLQAKADQAIAAASRNDEQLAVLFIDLDRFKQVNDSLGHPAGDELLRQVAARMQQELRASDIAGRLSGDEFVVVLPQCDAEHATDTVERIQALLSQPISIAQTNLSISASVGIAMYPSDGRDMETLLHRSDMAMYQAKSSGRGCFSFFSGEMNKLAQERLALETALREALQKNQLHLHYQPQIELNSGRLYGVEALARWTHPQLGEISPARFIPLAEECGLVADLGRWALREACRQLSDWRAKGLVVPAVAVNLSPTSFHNLDLPRMIADTLRSHRLAPEDLTLELTENILLDTNPSTMKTIEEVHAQGIRLSMDDFGTGYSSLSYLRRLPVSELKLDRSFVADLEHDEAARALSSAILGIGKSLHLTVVAEGVETDTQNCRLQEQGYPVAQGYLFSPPLAPAALEHWLGEWRQAQDADTAC